MRGKPIPRGGVGFFYGANMDRAKRPAGKKDPELEKESVPKAYPQEGARRNTSKKKKKVSPHALVEKAYQKVDERLEQGESSKAIDDLVKLMKLEKDLGGEQQDVKEIKVRWEPSAESSSEE